MSEKPSQVLLTKDTMIPVGAVVLVLTAAFSYGAMYQKVDTAVTRIDEQSEILDKQGDQISELTTAVLELTKEVNQLIGKNSLSYGGIKNIFDH